MTKIGRPRNNMDIIEELDPDTLYSPALIADLAMRKRLKQGHTPGKRSEAYKLAYTRIRIALGRWSNLHQLPDEGDGMIIIQGQAPVPGWFGWRWQKE